MILQKEGGRLLASPSFNESCSELSKINKVGLCLLLRLLGTYTMASSGVQIP